MGCRIDGQYAPGKIIEGKVLIMKYSKFIIAAFVGIGIAVTSYGKEAAATIKAPVKVAAVAGTTTPDAAIMEIANAIVNSQPQNLFKALPASYQKEISSVLSEAAKKMDAELWAEGRGLLLDLVNIAKTKKELILKTQMLAQVEDKAALNKSWDDGVAALTMLLNCDITNLEKLREANIVSLLTNVSETMKKLSTILSEQMDEKDDVLAKLKAMKVTVVSQEGNKATVKIETIGESPEIEELLLVEGKWIPKDFANGFAKGAKEAHENVAKIDFTSEQGKAMKAQIMQQLAMVKMMLKQAEAATTPQQFDGMLMGLMMSTMSMGGGGMPPPQQ